MGKRTRADETRAEEATTRGGMSPAMRWVIGVVAVVVAAGLGWAIWTSTQSGEDAATPAAGASADPNGGGTSGTDGAAPTPTTGASPGATPVDGSEVVAPDPQQTDSAALPALPQPKPLVSAPLPKDAAEQGALVDGYPTDVAAPAPASDVIDSSIASDGTTMQAALNARTDQTPDEIADHYRAVWAKLGLAPTTADGSTVAYADQFTSITLVARESGTGTVYTLYATLRTE